MNDPVKIIHKYKNNNGRVQYCIHIFIGDIVDEKCMKVLKKIKNLDLYKSWTSLDEREREIIEKNYGEFWYEKFFNSYHISNTIEITEKNPDRIRELRSIYQEKWITDHIINFQKRLEVVTFNYEYTIKEERERKMVKKVMAQQKQEVEDFVDYTTVSKTGHALSNFPKEFSRPVNYCSDESSEEEEVDDFGLEDFISSDSEAEIVDLSSDSEDSDLDPNQLGGEIEPEPTTDFTVAENVEIDFENLLQEQENTDFDMEVERDVGDIELIFTDLDEADKNIKVTTKEIKEAISEKMYEKINKQVEDFDSSKDNNMFDENLKDVYSKNYITYQYIFDDDTIKNIRNKICCGFKNNNKYGENVYIIPSYQYLWTEYMYDGKIEKVMLGQKWIIRNDILKLDVEPNTNMGVYEDLRGNLKNLRDKIKRHGKVKLEDDENNILVDYKGYYTFNEIFMIDVYNEFGSNYSASLDDLKNVMDVYLKIYFPRIRPDDFGNIVEFLNTNISENKKNAEYSKLKLIFESINNNLILENEIMHNIEYTRKTNENDYKKLFLENYVNQSVVRVYTLERNKKIDLFRIFDNFVLGDVYPFIQFQSTDGTQRSRFNEKILLGIENKDIVMKWFENSPYGISFKLGIKEKEDYRYMTVNLSDTGRIDYKIQWKEEDMFTVDDIKKTYPYIKELLEKINKENQKFSIKLRIPTNDQFKFAFINTIQKFELPNNFNINHNDLSEFSRYFFPYVALVIAPRKRQAKMKKEDTEEKSKFGTYLRYKRISKFENKTKIEHRILFFIRNYEYDDQSLTDEISKEFNITEEQAFSEIDAVRKKYPNIKKARKVLKKLENIPKYKPPGIGIDIQGKTRNKYKMRITGARDKEQLDKIISFMNILIYLYTETYLYKKPERQKMKDLLKRLTKIAKRRNRVEEIVDYETTIKNVKQMTIIDKKRLSAKKEEDQSQWTRDCQNSGKDKKRRPQQFLNIEELHKLGYVWKEKLDGEKFGHFERKVMVDADGKTTSNKKKKETILRAIQLPLDDSGENFVYYTCGPEENGKHMYVGFLGGPNSRPCCFIKDQLYSKNKDKRNLFLKSIGLTPSEEVESGEEIKLLNEKLYVLQDGARLPEDRIAFLPKYLDIFLNFMTNNDRIMKNHYLISTSTGYYFKYGIVQDKYKYLNAVCSVFGMTTEEIKARLIKTLESDKNMLIFTSLQNGDIRTRFGTVSAYIAYINTNEYLEYNMLNDLLCLPGVIRKHGINILIFHKKIQLIKKSFEKEKIKESYYLICQNQENLIDLEDPKRETAILIKDSKNYYPIVMVKKMDEEAKEIDISKIFYYKNEPKNILNHIYKYYKINCQNEYHVLVDDKSIGTNTAKETDKILEEIGKKEYLPRWQIIDTRYKCKYIITQNGSIVPTVPSGTVYHINISNTYSNHIKSYEETVKYLNEIDDLTKSKLKLKPIGLFYSEKKEKKYYASYLMTENYNAVPIIPKMFTIDEIKKDKLYLKHKLDDDLIDKQIEKGKNNFVIDDRINSVATNKYQNELYQLFRYHLSYYLNKVTTGQKYKTKIEKIIEDVKKPKNEKKLELKRVLYQMTSSELASTFIELVRNKKKINFEMEQMTDEQLGGELLDPFPADIHFPPDSKTWMHLIPDSKKIDYPSYVIKNNRELCYRYPTKDACHANQFCHWLGQKNMCVLDVDKPSLIDFINKISEELLQNELKASEILRRGNYFVSDIGNYNIFTERPGEKVLVTTNMNMEKILSEIFGKDNIPKIGKRYTKKNKVSDYYELNVNNPLRDIGTWYVQNILENNNSIFRAFANAYFWLLNPYNDTNTRNLAYYSILQTNLSNVYKSQVIDWLLSPENSQMVESLKKYIAYGNISEYITRLSMSVVDFSDGFIELIILSKINDTIIYIYDENYKIIYVFHPVDNFVYNYKKTEHPFDMQKYQNYKKNVNLKFQYLSKNIYPDKIEALYPKK